MHIIREKHAQTQADRQTMKDCMLKKYWPDVSKRELTKLDNRKLGHLLRIK